MSKKKLKVDLDEIASAMEDQDRDINDYYLNIETGELYALDRQLLKRIEEGKSLDDIPEWMKEEIPVARAVFAEAPRYRRVPENLSEEAYGIMEDFVYKEVENERARAKLANAIRGRGAFRYFKDVLDEFPDLRERWYEYDTQRRREWALEWLEELGIEAEEEPPSSQ